MHELHTTRRVEFADTDMGGIVHFSRYLVFMETAEHEFLRAAGTDVDLRLPDGRRIGWPRVAVSCEYKSPARYGDLLDIHVRVLRKGRSSLSYGIRFSCGGREVAEGRVTSVCCELAPGEEVRSIPIPDSIARRIDQPPDGR
ncbi:MAG TPA: thioesterase family protein [Candidatus Polarisedimenticolaceae bacterium]|nr:thioesterase family protein [Candidatus Polarisedimenticolaceae bacterium]